MNKKGLLLGLVAGWAIGLGTMAMVAAVPTLARVSNPVDLSLNQGPQQPEVQVAAQALKPNAQWVPSIMLFTGRRPSLTLIGSGFPPNKELAVRIIMGGVLSDISFLMEPRPVTNDEGAFASVFQIRDRFWSAGLLLPQPMTTQILDAETGELLATAPLAFCDPEKPKEEKAAWCPFAEAGK